MKIIPYPETRQVFNFDCGANALVSVLVFAGIEEREDRVALLAGTTKHGTGTAGILRVLDYYGLAHNAGRMIVSDLREGIDRGFPTLLTLQAYRESSRPYRELWDDGHWVVAIGYDDRRILFEDPLAFHRTWLADVELSERWHDVDRGKRIRQWGCTVQVVGHYEHDRIVHMD
jgi:ABC-type bacteriocin/lantibiotic exporter with double-glycine peptidase domain